jgi:hypothetical protein
MKTLPEYLNISQSEKKMEKYLIKKQRFSPTLHRGVGICLEKIFPLDFTLPMLLQTVCS